MIINQGCLAGCEGYIINNSPVSYDHSAINADQIQAAQDPKEAGHETWLRDRKTTG